MTLRSLDHVRRALDLQTDDPNSIYKVVRELRGLRVQIVRGNAAGGNVDVPGIVSNDAIVACIGFDLDNAVLANRVTNHTSNCTIPEENKVKIATDNTSAKMLMIVWRDQNWDPYNPPDAPALRL